MAALADYVHSKGLKLGLYTCVGTETCKKNRPGSYGMNSCRKKMFVQSTISQREVTSRVNLGGRLLKTCRPHRRKVFCSLDCSARRSNVFLHLRVCAPFSLALHRPFHRGCRDLRKLGRGLRESRLLPRAGQRVRQHPKLVPGLQPSPQCFWEAHALFPLRVGRKRGGCTLVVIHGCMLYFLRSCVGWYLLLFSAQCSGVGVGQPSRADVQGADGPFAGVALPPPQPLVWATARALLTSSNGWGP